MQSLLVGALLAIVLTFGLNNSAEASVPTAPKVTYYGRGGHWPSSAPAPICDQILGSWLDIYMDYSLHGVVKWVWTPNGAQPPAPGQGQDVWGLLGIIVGQCIGVRADGSNYAAEAVVATTSLPVCPDKSSLNADGLTCTCASGYQEDPTGTSCMRAIPAPPPLGSTAGMCTPNPISPATGEKYRVEQDWADRGPSALSLVRTYRSGWADDSTHALVGMGQVWTHNYNTVLKASPSDTPTAVTITVAEGYAYTFVRPAGSSVWNATNSADALTQTGSGTWSWRRSDDDTTYNFTADGKLQSQVARNGWTTTLSYNGSGQLASITNAFGRSLALAYTGGRLTSATTPDGRVIAYAYDSAGRLASVTYPNGTNRSFAYENTSFPQALTGINDEAGTRWGTFSYDPQGRAVSSMLAGGVSDYEVRYPSSKTATIIDPLGTSRSYSYNIASGKLAVTSASLTSSLDDAASRVQDANGLITRETNFNGISNATSWDASRHLPTSSTEAEGQPQARTTTTQWHPTFSLPVLVTEPGRSSTYTYDANGNLLSLTATSTLASTNASRTWRWTYDDHGLVAAATEPSGAVTTYGYDTFGNLVQSSDAMGHVTKYSYDSANRLVSIVDPNGVVTAYTWDARDRLITQTVGGQQSTAFTYNPTGTLATLTLPTGESVSYNYDAAQRLTGVSDSLGNSITYTLDAMGNRTQDQVKDPSGNLARQITRVFDSMNRLLQVTLGMVPPPGSNPAPAPAPLVKLTPAGVTASGSYGDGYTPSMAVDGNASTVWLNTFPTQWIEVDLGAPVVLRSIRMLINQQPDGQTTHVITGDANPAPTNVLQTLSGATADQQWLTFTPSSALPPTRYIRITTTASPSWVSWRELEFYQ